MNRKLLALVAAFVLLALAVTPGMAQVSPAAPDAAAAPAAVRPVSPDAAPAPALPTPAEVDETKVPHYFGPYPNWANSQFTLPKVEVTINAAGLPVAPITVGNALIARQYASDDTVGSAGSGVPGQGTVLVVIPTALPAGTLTSFQTYTQNAPALASPGNTFNAYVLRPTAALDEYSIVYDSGPLTVPAEVDGVHTWPVAGTPAVEQGDVIAFYGQGIPLDITGPDAVYYVAPTAPTSPFTVNAGAFPNLGSTRTYSFAATVMPPSGPAAGTGATAAATVGANGAITGLTITNPGSGYAAATVAITGAGAGATASADVQTSGAVTSVAVDVVGSGYTAPSVTITGGGGTTQATAHALGGVDAVDVSVQGEGYTIPTVDFDMPDDPNGTQAQGHAVCAVTGGIAADCSGATANGQLTVTGVMVDSPGSGYATAPGVVVRDGTLFDPINPGTNFVAAAATATLSILSVVVDTFGAGYTSAPDVAFADTGAGVGAGAAATATTDFGAVVALHLLTPGSGYITPGIKKFEDALPGLCAPPACPTTGKYIPLAVPAAKSYPPLPDPKAITADEYVIGLVQYKTSFSSSLPDTLVRGYVQLETADNIGISQHFPLQNTLVNGTKVDVKKADDTQWLAVTPPQWLGPTIVASKNKPVRIVFHNLLPTGVDGNLFLPVDTTLMGSGTGPVANMPPVAGFGTVVDEIRNPACSQPEKWDNMECFRDNRATLHLHGGITPWISDGTPHQWITPDTETTLWPQGVSVGNVPDMNVCKAADDGCQTFYYTNQQSARLMFYHDHAWGITRLNVYAGEAAGYVITDEVEQKLFGTVNGVDGPYKAMGEGIPLVVQDRTFVPDPVQLAQQDPTWDTDRWGGMGNFWYHHVYMPAQNPGDPDGMSSYGRWMYGPWFWPPATPPNGPIANPYYNMDPKGLDGTRGTADDFEIALAVACNLDDPATWQYDTDPFCEPKEIPGTPNISVGMEQFNDTPIVNGVAYPTLTLEPKSYRFRVLSAANDRFFNFQWYVGDDSTASTGLNKANGVIGATEVALKPLEVEAAQTDPVVFPTPVLANVSTAGPDWVQIGTEGGFLPAPVVVDGQQPTTWITDPTRFDVGLVDQHSLLLAPAERADVIVDFSKFAGQTLILYNDAPAAFPARVPSYDYYTGAPDQFPNAAPVILPGYGPNTRTIMQVKIAGTAAPAFNVTALKNLFTHKANGSGVFEKGQPPIFVGQAAYNSAYGTSFAASSDCNAPGSTVTRCDGYVRINDGTQVGSTWGFNTLKAPTAKMPMKLEPKAIHDEMNSTAFDEFGRMTANLGIEAQPPTPGNQNVTLYPYINPATELIDATNLPKHDVIYDANTGLPVGDVKIQPISSAADGSQIWRITHNGVDTHPIHFHLYDVQVLNRVAWDNNLKQVDATELGWKDTVRISPLEDTIVALRPIIPDLPWELPNAIRLLNPMMPLGFTNPDPAFPNIPFNNTDPQGIPTAPIVNELANFGWEYVFHCHILSHEEMDMMRPVLVAMPPVKPDGLTATFLGVGATRQVLLTWNDNSIAETAYRVERSTDSNTWTTVGTILSPLDASNTTGPRTFDDITISQATLTYQYRIVAENKVGYLGADGAFPTLTVKSVSATASVDVTVDPPVADVTPTTLAFGSVATGATSASQLVTVTNTGASALTVGPVSLIGTLPAQFSFVNNCTTVAPAGTCTISVAFAPTTDGAKSATLEIAHNALGSPSTVDLTGMGVLAPPVASVAPPSLAFGNVLLTTPVSLDVTVSNTGASDLLVGPVSLTGANPGQFTHTGNNCTTVAQGTNCTISVTFTPTTAGAKSATLSIGHNAAGTPSLVTLTGTGVAPTTFSLPITQDFGTKAINTSTLKTVLVTNRGQATLFITSASAPAPFSTVTLGTCASPVNVGKTCKLNVTFAPTPPTGLKSVTLTVVSLNAPTVTMSLTGTAR